MKNFQVYIAIAWLFSLTYVNGNCPDMKLKKDFEISKYLGLWYEVQSQPSIFQSIKSCLESSYTLDGENIQVTSEGLDSSGASAKTSSILTVEDPTNPAHMVTDFVPGISPPFDIVDTDYDNFSCAHSCVSIVTMKTEFVFIYSRNRTLDPKLVEHCRAIFESYGIDTSGLVDVPQKNCHNRSEL